MLAKIIIMAGGILGGLIIVVGVPFTFLSLLSVLFGVSVSLKNYLIVFTCLFIVREILNESVTKK